MRSEGLKFFRQRQQKTVKEIQTIVEKGIQSGEITEITPPGYRINVCLNCFKKLELKIKATEDDAILPDMDFPFGEDDQPEGFCRCHFCGEIIYSYGKNLS